MARRNAYKQTTKYNAYDLKPSNINNKSEPIPDKKNFDICHNCIYEDCIGSKCTSIKGNKR